MAWVAARPPGGACCVAWGDVHPHARRQWWPWLVARRGSDSTWDAVLVPARAAGALQLQLQAQPEPEQPETPHRDVPCRRPWAACCLRTGGGAAARLHVVDADSLRVPAGVRLHALASAAPVPRPRAPAHARAQRAPEPLAFGMIC